MTVTLDGSDRMLATLKLSKFPQVVIGAHISKSSNALPQGGDVQVLSGATDVHRKDDVHTKDVVNFVIADAVH